MTQGKAHAHVTGKLGKDQQPPRRIVRCVKGNAFPCCQLGHGQMRGCQTAQITEELRKIGIMVGMGLLNRVGSEM